MLKHILLCLALCCVTTISAQESWRTDFRHSTDTIASTEHEGADNGAPFRAMSTTLSNGLGVYGETARGTVASIGSPRIPVILVAFADLDFLSENAVEKVSRWLNEEGYHDETYAVGSVADYFRDNSYGLFTPSFDIAAKVTVSQPYAYYGAHSGSSVDARAQTLVREAIDLAIEQGVDFSSYADDGQLPIVSIIHAGPGEQEDFGYIYDATSSDNYIWAHYRSLGYTKEDVSIASYIITNESMRNFDYEGNVTSTVMTGIGTFCHEFCHSLGLPDTYDVNGAAGGAGQTPGFWDVMDYQFMLNGYRPGCLNAYERCCLGWLELPELTELGLESIVLAPLDADNISDGALRAVRITNPFNPAEHFIFENRQPSRWHVDCYGNTFILGTGMLAWHIDYNASSWNANSVNTNASHQRVSVVPADGVWQSPVFGTEEHYGDLFPGAQHIAAFDANVAEFYDGPLTTPLNFITEEADGSITFYISKPTYVKSLTSQAYDHHTYDLQGRPTTQTKGIIINNGNIKIKTH